MKKRRGTPSCNRIVTSVFAMLLCASAAQADNHKANNAAGYLNKEANLNLANVLANPLPAKTITGTVVDAKGETLIGVTVTEQGTTKAVATDASGKYSISVEGDNSVLVFAYLGYETQSVTVGARTVVNVTMASRSSALEEVVVTALGIKRESKKLGYATTSVKTDEMVNNRTNNMMASLEGKVAGLDISPPTSGAGGSTRIRLRGQSGFAGGNNAPLIVLNGLPMDQGARGASGNDTRDSGDNMTQFNPDDVETMTVLKGATAAALYGERASNGAILITTKSGSKNSAFGVEFSSNYSSDEVLDFTRFQTIYGQGQGGVKPANAAVATSTGQLGWGAKHDGQLYTQFDGVQRPYSYQPNRIKDFYRSGSTFNNTIAFSAGNASTSYRASFSNQNSDGITPNNSYNRKIFNLGLNSKVTEKLTFQFNVNYTNENNNNPPQVGAQGTGAPNFLNRMSGTIPLSAFENAATNPDGSERPVSGFYGTLVNPYWSLPRQFYYRKSDRILSTVTARYDFAKWLYVQGRVNADFGSNSTEQNTPSGLGRAILNNTNDAFSGDYNIGMTNFRNMNMDVLLGSNHKIGDFGIDVSLGGNIRDDFSRTSAQTATGFIVKDQYSIANGFNRTSTYGIGRRQVNSVYGVAEFSYKSYLYLTVTDRIDYYSVLTPPSALVSSPKNSYNYPSFSASFVFSELLPNVSWLNYGKLRASYADVGNAGIGEFGGQLTYGIAQNLFGTYQLGSISNGDNPNPFIGPYSVSEKEIGLELKTLNSRLNFDISAYDKQTRNQIIRVPLSISSGYGGTNLNLGKLQNRGVEVLIDAVPVRTSNFSWNTAINSAYNMTKVLDLGGPQRQVVTVFGGNEFIGSLVYEVGKEMNQLAARTYVRDDQGRAIVRSNGFLSATSSDVLFGSANPKVTGGWNNNFRYKKLSLLVHIDWKLGGKILSSTALNGARQGLTELSLVGREGGVIFPGVYANGQPNTTPVPGQAFYTDYRTQQIADPFIYNGSFVKLRNITLAYDFTNMVTNKVKFVKGLTLSASVRNVAILKKYIPDVDPEAFASSGDNRLGYEQTTLPTTRTWGLNLNVKF